MTRLIIIRHGESVTNFTGIFTGQLDVPLTEQGQLQAELAARYVCENFKIDEIYSSDLQRAYNTALPIAKRLGLEIKTSEKIRELDAGDWKGIHFKKLDELYPEERKRYAEGKSYSRCTGGESIGELYERSVGGFLEIAAENDGKTVAVTSHGGAIRCFIGYAADLDADSFRDIPGLKNTEICIFEVEGNKATLIKRNITDHLTVYEEKTTTESIGKET